MDEHEEEQEVGRLRRAWCELTGGHASSIEGAWLSYDLKRATHVRLRCRKCGRVTKFFGVPFYSET